MADPKDIALDHFEKVLLLIAAALLGVVGVGSVGEPDELKKAQGLNKDANKVKSFMSSSKPKLETLPSAVKELTRNLDSGEVPNIDSLPGWVSYRRPGVLARYKKQKPKENASHAPPIDVKGDAGERGKIVVSWGLSQGNQYVVVTEFHVQRREGEDGEWKTIANLKGGETSYEDKDLKSRKTYFYRVLSLAEIDQESPTVRNQKLTLDPSEAEKSSSSVGPFKTARDVYVIPSNVTPVTQDMLIKDRNAKARAYVYVYKWDAASNQFLKKGFAADQGQMIGSKDPVKMRINGDRREVDFNTGAILEDCKEETRPGKFGQQTKVGVIVIKWPDGSTEEATTQDDEPGKDK